MLTGEEVLEDLLGLPLGRVFEVDPNVHPAWPAQSGVQTLNVIGGSEQYTGRLDTSAQLESYRDLENATHRPSVAATPSKLFRRPLKVRVDSPLLLFSKFGEVGSVEGDGPIGAPVDLSSREIPRVKAASKSSRSKILLKTVG